MSGTQVRLFVGTEEKVAVSVESVDPHDQLPAYTTRPFVPWALVPHSYMSLVPLWPYKGLT